MLFQLIECCCIKTRNLDITSNKSVLAKGVPKIETNPGGDLLNGSFFTLFCLYYSHSSIFKPNVKITDILV